jgi:cytochrome c-type biogenesis protein CcmH
MKKRYAWGIIIGISLGFFSVSAAMPASVNDIAQALTCTCGCGLLVSACEDSMTCHEAAGLKQEIRVLLNQDLSQKEILDEFVNRYGEQILAAPTTAGFNLTAWMLPFVVVFAGIGGLYAVLTRWVARPQPTRNPVSLSDKDAAYLEQVEKELKTFNE